MDYDLIILEWYILLFALLSLHSLFYDLTKDKAREKSIKSEFWVSYIPIIRYTITYC